MEKVETREVKVGYCDLCGVEASHLEKCAICKREICGKDGYGFHSAYSLEIYRYADANRLVSGYICKECADKPLTITVRELLEGMWGRTPIQLQ